MYFGTYLMQQFYISTPIMLPLLYSDYLETIPSSRMSLFHQSYEYNYSEMDKKEGEKN